MILSPSGIDQLLSVARGAGARILPYFRSGQMVRKKQDRSPVTDADLAAHDFIVAALSRHFPGVPVISEEDAPPAGWEQAARFFLVDPLDGTRSFVRGEDEFTVNIGLVEGGAPIFGVLHSPVSGEVYHGGPGMGAFKNGAPIRVRPAPAGGVTVTRSRSSASVAAREFLATLRVADVISASSAVKFGWVAEGRADVYPRFGRTMEWDTAAGQAIVEGAGGRVEMAGGGALTYGKPGFENPGFIAWGA